MKIKVARPLIWLLFIGYTSCLLYWMFLGFGRNMHTTGQLAYNVVPVRTIGMYVLHADSFSTRTWIINLFGNIGVFIPYGFLLQEENQIEGIKCEQMPQHSGCNELTPEEELNSHDTARFKSTITKSDILSAKLGG